MGLAVGQEPQEHNKGCFMWVENVERGDVYVCGI